MTQKKILWEECDWFDDEPDSDEVAEEQGFDDGYGEGHQHGEHMKIHKLIQTPFGIASYDDRMSPIHDTIFIIAHLNFNLSVKRIEAIKKVDGVEFLQPLSRYRFIIGVGRMFDMLEVCESIEQVLEINPEHEVQKIKVNEITSPEVQEVMIKVGEMTKDYEFWAGYIFPNGEIVVNELDSEDSVRKKREEFNTWQKESQGLVITSIE